jgi:hypothetical protein
MSLSDRFKNVASTTLNSVNEARNKTYYFAENIPFIDAQITTNIPDMGIAAAILSSTIDDVEGLKELQKKFENLKKHCDKVEKQILKYQTDIQKVLAITSLIKRRMRTFEDTLNALAEFVPLVKNILRIARAIIAVQVSVPVAGGFVQGSLIIKQKEIIDKVISKLEEILALQLIFTSLRDSVQSTAEEIESVLLPIQNKLSLLNLKFTTKCNIIDTLFLQVLAQIDFNDLGERENEEYQAAVTIASTLDIERVIDNLELSSRPRFFEFLSENGYTGYRIVKI